MTTPRESLNPFTTIQPADRIPSHGVQLSADGTADIHSRADVCWDCATAGMPTGREPIPSPIVRPVALNLWDTSPDSLPEGWTR